MEGGKGLMRGRLSVSMRLGRFVPKLKASLLGMEGELVMFGFALSVCRELKALGSSTSHRLAPTLVAPPRTPARSVT